MSVPAWSMHFARCIRARWLPESENHMSRRLLVVTFLFGTWITSSLRPGAADPMPMDPVSAGSCATAGCSDVVAMARPPARRPPPRSNNPSSSSPNLGVYRSANFAPGQLDAHYNKHRAEWSGGITKADYLAKARNLLAATPSGKVLQKVRPNGDVLHYDQSANEFAIGAGGGTIRTLFRPSGGIRYWNKQ